MKSQLKKVIVVLMMIGVFVPSSYADDGDGDNHSQGMETMMYVMMGGMIVWMVYRIATGPSYYASMEEFQKEYSPVSSASEPLLFTAKSEPASQQEKVNVMLVNYTF